MAHGKPGSAFRQAERDHAIVGVVADVGASAKRNAGAAAPIGDDRRFIAREFGVVGDDVGDTPKSQPSRPADVFARRDMEHGAVDPVKLLDESGKWEKLYQDIIGNQSR